ncbi:hypothetical protein [Limnohabitans sp.]|uniref:hypothetical protein n=1 Tax=Limnohabitans sp. TaxID=1907725 RepID=UPI00334133C0
MDNMNLDLATAIRTFEVLLGWSLLLQTLEYLKLVRMDRVGDWGIQRQEIPNLPMRWLLDRLFEVPIYKGLLWMRCLFSLVLMAGHAELGVSLTLFVLAVLLLLRWRGAFNGGSDFMSLVGLTGLLLAHGLSTFTEPAEAWRIAFWYVTLQSLGSYFVSGWIKFMRPEWRSGQALTVFLDQAVHGPLPEKSIFRSPRVARICSWSFILWEGLFPMALWSFHVAAVFCAVAAVFHFLVYWFFGLNRFFWA